MRYAIKMLATISILLAGCSLFPPPAEAGTVVVSWTNPIQNTDNSAIPTTQGDPEALQVWRIEYGTCNGTAFGSSLGFFTRARTTAGPELTSATQNLPAGQKCFRVFVSNTAGNESDASNVSAREIPAGKPKPVTNVQAVLQST